MYQFKIIFDNLGKIQTIYKSISDLYEKKIIMSQS